MADIKVSQMGEVLVASDNDLLNLVTYDEQNQTYVSGKVKSSTMKDYMIGDTDISELGDGTPTGAIDALDGKIDDNYDEGKEQWQKNGAYNLCPVLNTTQVINGVTWTVNSDGTVTANCSSNNHAKSIFWLWINSDYKVSYPYVVRVLGAPSGASTNTYHIGGYVIGVVSTGKDIPANTAFNVALIVAENAVVDNIVFKPMITTDLNATYDDYVPYAKTNRELTEDTNVKEIDPSNLSSAKARVSLESSDNIIIRRIGRLVIIEKLGILISAGADLPYNVGVLITGLPAPESDKCVLMATGNAHTGFKSVGFTVNANGSLIPASFNNIPANANNQAAYFIGGACYIAKE